MASKGESAHTPKWPRPRPDRAGIERPDLAQALQSAVEGTQAGIYRERDELIPIVARAPETERTDMDNLGSAQIWSPGGPREMIPLEQMISRFRGDLLKTRTSGAGTGA